MRLGKWTLGFGLYIIISASFMRQVWEFLGNAFGRDNVQAFFIGLFLIAFISVIVYTARSRFSVLRLAVNLAVIIYALIFAWRQPFFTERVHILEYGLLGYLAARDLSKSNRPGRAVFLALLFALFIGSADEFFQKLLPYRVGEIRDALTNLVSGSLGVILFQCRKFALPLAKGEGRE